METNETIQTLINTSRKQNNNHRLSLYIDFIWDVKVVEKCLQMMIALVYRKGETKKYTEKEEVMKEQERKEKIPIQDVSP